MVLRWHKHSVNTNLGTILDFGMREELVQLIPNIYWLRIIYEIITQWLNLVNLSELYMYRQLLVR